MRPWLPLCLAVAGCGIGPLFDDNGPGDDYQPISALDPAQSQQDLAFCVSEINRYRAMRALQPLAQDAEMEAFAAEGASVDAYAGEPHTHFKTTPFPGTFRFLGENEARNWSLREHHSVRTILSKSLAQMWAEGPGGGHYENMIADFTQVGCGLYLDVPSQSVTTVQDFRIP